MTGFCWLTPEERFPGLRDPVKTSSHSAGRPSTDEFEHLDEDEKRHLDENQKRVLSMLRELEDEKKNNEDVVKKLWPSGAFVYRFPIPPSDRKPGSKDVKYEAPPNPPPRRCTPCDPRLRDC